MYIDIDFATLGKIELKTTSFSNCESKDSTPPQLSPLYGFGGAIFLITKGEYIPDNNRDALKDVLFG
jgi:hypothetical protein